MQRTGTLASCISAFVSMLEKSRKRAIAIVLSCDAAFVTIQLCSLGSTFSGSMPRMPACIDPLKSASKP